MTSSNSVVIEADVSIATKILGLHHPPATARDDHPEVWGTGDVVVVECPARHAAD